MWSLLEIADPSKKLDFGWDIAFSLLYKQSSKVSDPGPEDPLVYNNLKMK